MNILHIIFTLNIGGAETMLVDIVNEQSKTDNVCVVIIDDSYNNQILSTISKSVHVELVHRKPGSKSLVPFIKLNTYILRKRPDILHIHNWQTPRILLPCFRPVFTVHGLGRPSTYYNRLRGIIAISEAVKEDVLSHGQFNVAVIPNGIVTESVAVKTDLRRDATFKIIQVGRLKTQVKGQDILIEAISKLQGLGHGNITLDIIGDGESKIEIQEQIERLGLSSTVNLRGSLPRREFYSHLREYDLLCQPSRKEGFGLTVAEAMIAKVPVLVSDTGGPIEIIEHGKLGYSFRSNDSFSCAIEIDRIINEYGNNEMKSKIEGAYKKAISLYSIKKMVEDYKVFYSQI